MVSSFESHNDIAMAVDTNMIIRWLRGPTSTGLWWFWLLGSSIVRCQQVVLMNNRLCVFNDGFRQANKCARLWCKATRHPKLPPVHLRKKLEVELRGHS